MPERSGILNIVDDICGAESAKAKRFLSRNIICNIPEVSQTAKQGPVPPKRAGAHAMSRLAFSGVAHKVMRLNHSNGLGAILRNFRAPR
jgi:hypothetical protein